MAPSKNQAPAGAAGAAGDSERFEVEVALTITKNGKPFSNTRQRYENMRREHVLDVEREIIAGAQRLQALASGQAGN